MHLLIDMLAATDGGAGLTRVREIARELPPRAALSGDTVSIAVRPSLQPAVRDIAPDVWLLPVPAMTDALAGRLLWEHIVLPWQRALAHPDVVFSPFNSVPVLWRRPRPKLAVMVSNLGPFAPTVLARCTRGERARNAMLRRLTRLCISRADWIFLQSRHAAEVLRLDNLSIRAEVVPQQPPKTPAFSAHHERRDTRRPYAIVVADLCKFKGIETVIDAFAMTQRDAVADLVICGRPIEPDYADELQAMAKRLGVAEHVRFLGHTPHNEVLTLLRGALVAVASSRFENFSRIPSEAMACGAPLVACDIPAYREACNGAALYYREDDASQLARHLATVSADASVREQLISSGRQRLLELGRTSAYDVIFARLKSLGDANEVAHS